MESLVKEDQRKIALRTFIQNECGIIDYDLHLIVPDASFRRYFRVMTANGSYVAMDADPKIEDCRHYIAVAEGLRAIGLQTPELIKTNAALGFLLITDFGDATFLRTLNHQNADQLYTSALQTLSLLQTCERLPGKEIPPFSRLLMMDEWAWFKGWFLQQLLALDINDRYMTQLDACYARLVDAARAQPQFFMHRDYHSQNLMWLPNQSVGILDFQDAFIGPITYDLVSLLRDCYIDWPQEKVTTWVNQYIAFARPLMQKAISQEQFLVWFDWMGIQRHLKTLMTFSRKYLRDHNPHYLRYIPRTLQYLLSTSERYPECAPLYTYLNQIVLPAFKALHLP